jgi:hypothetical protein
MSHLRSTRIAVGALFVAGLCSTLGACAGGSAGSSPSTRTDDLVTTSLETGLSFQRPAAWHSRPTTVIPPGPGFVLDVLTAPGVTATWTFDAQGHPMTPTTTIAGLPATYTDSSHPTCSAPAAEREIVVSLAGSGTEPSTRRYELDACLSGPHVDTAQRQVDTLLASVRLTS